MTVYGYARTSTTHQNLEPQLEALKEYNTDVTIYHEQVSGKNSDRPQLKALLDTVKAGDTVVITKIDRMARNTKDLLELVDYFNENKVGLVILNMGGQTVDTSTPVGKLLITMLGGIAEFEREIMLERQKEGIAVAKKKGKYNGRPAKYTDKHAGLSHAIELYKGGYHTVKEICEITKVGRATLYNNLKKQGLTS